MDDEVFFLSATEMAARIRRRELSPVELIDALFARIERVASRFLELARPWAHRRPPVAERAATGGP